MGAGNENQLEFFDVTRQPAPRPHRESLGRVWLQLRYDQLLLGTMAGVIGLTIVFACGVERGKQLVRASAKPKVIVVEAPEQPAPQAAITAPPATEVPVPSFTPALKPAATPVKKEPAKAKTGRSRYAVQVSTFSKPQMAKQEMDRLRANGEPAFLVIREGRTMVYVGPFPSKDNAAAKSTNLRSKYSDCFVKTL
jgi:cell division septation protein DedD